MIKTVHMQLFSSFWDSDGGNEWVHEKEAKQKAFGDNNAQSEKIEH